MRTSTKRLTSGQLGIASLLAGGVLLPASAAHAQIDVTPPMPNVLLMLDTSGSMTRKMGSDAFPDCAADNAADLNGGRWFAVVQALTGSLPAAGAGKIECEAIDRSSAAFTTMFGSNLYDFGYYLPFQQIQSSGCGWVPDPARIGWNNPLTFSDWPTGAIQTNGGCSFVQANNGIIDTYKRQIRFGLMTFDPATDAQTGLENGAGNVVTQEGHEGTWSYWFRSGTQNYIDAARPPTYSNTENDNADDGIAKGKPPACGTLLPMEVGARGPIAPPWEGRLMGFGDYQADSTAVAAQNERIEQIILSMRPYGATPLAGMLSDAEDFFIEDDTQLDDGVNPAVPLGPRADPYWDLGAGCRPTHVILITDGEPNLDLRPDCELDDPGGDATLDGVCPFNSIVHTDTSPVWFDGDDEEDSIVNKLAGAVPGGNNVTFHVIGVSLDTLTDPAGELCAEYRPGGTRIAQCENEALTPGTITAQEKTCCMLNAIADVGGSGAAHFPTDITGLQNALNIVLTTISEGTATRTAPVYQSVAPTFFVEVAAAGAVGHEMLSSLKTTVGDGLWGGRLERIRIACEDPDGAGGDPPLPVRQDFDRTLGDDFGHNLASAPGNRYMITAVADSGAADSWQSLRPGAGVADGLTRFDIAAPIVGVATDWVDDVDSAAFGLDSTPGGACIQEFGAGASTDDACRTELLTWFTGLDSSSVGGDRCPLPYTTETCKTLGAIYHSQPIIVGPPREFLRDEAYDLFAQTFESRPTVVYAQTVDGQLHAFLLADNTARLSPAGQEISQVDQRELSELWSFVPPIALPFLKEGVNRHQVLLDGGIVAKNVVFERLVSDSTTTVDAFTAKGYRTALVGSSGRVSEAIPGGGYYYALDVTDPHAVDTDFDGNPIPGDPRDESPKFLWQLSRGEAGPDVDDDPMFGDSVPTAAIATIAYTPPSSADPPTEVAVAILAGGMSDPPAGVPVYGAAYPNTATLSGLAGTRTIRDWGVSRVDRSITIVRIDTGEVLMRFRAPTDPAFFLPAKVRNAGFKAPMSGTPVAFPGLPGQVSTRVYLGDAEGALWVMDLSSPDPTNWDVKLAWDVYDGLGAEIENGDFVPGPVETVPVISVDAAGNPVVVYATGSQADFHEREGKNFVVALRDDPDDGVDGLALAWRVDLEEAAGPINGGPGHRVTGPLNIFDSKVFFATFRPDTDPCEVGVGRIWGVRYIDNVANDPIGIMGALEDQLYEENAEVIAFGVSIGQQPSCRNSAVDVIPDDVFGSYTSFEISQPGQFELVVQTGRKGAPNTGATQATTKTLTFPLESARATVRVNSWAAIVE